MVLEGSQLAPQYLSKLIIVIAIAYTSATMQGKKIKDMGIQKYVTRGSSLLGMVR
ncbi:MAG: hypothetical protein RPG89_13065 [Microcystis panniformis WG22]|nr:hypothetical protein [Microcystis panniformis WG22]